MLVSDKTTAVSVTFNGGTAVDVKVGGVVKDSIKNIENIITCSGNDTLIGDALANTFSGGSLDATDNIIYLKQTGDLYYDRDGSGTTYSAIKFADLAANTTVNFSQFLLIE